MVKLVLVLGDQCSPELASLKAARKGRDVVVMAEVAAETDYVPHHPKKIALLFSAMRHFADELRGEGWDVRYTTLDDPENAGSIPGELLRRADETGATEVIATEPGEWRLLDALNDCPLDVTVLEDDRFLATHAEFEDWAEGRESLRMEYFYRLMRRKTGLLMEGDDPAGGAWNYDAENRKPPPEGVDFGGPMQFTPDAITEDVLSLVEARFGGNFGRLRPFTFAVTRGQARRALSHFIRNALPRFGDYQDAMLSDNRFLYHALISPYLNAGLLTPLEICRAAEDAWKAGDAPLNAVEGFIRQIIGWREYMRGVWWRQGPDYVERNGLDHNRSLPGFFWNAETDMRCLKLSIEATRDEAYSHHIQRLMVLGNFTLLSGIDPREVHDWFLAVYADAFGWVMGGNVIGMSQFADGGIVASKPYVSSGNYINKMSDYCGDCAYSVTKKTGEGACPFNLLYWHFMDRHRTRFESNARIGRIYSTWDRMDEEKKGTIREEAQAFLNRMAQGARV